MRNARRPSITAMPLTPRSEPRRKGSPRWFLVFWLVLLAFRLWPVNHGLALVLGAIALLILLSGLRRTEQPFSGGGGTGTLTAPTRAPNVETITMPAQPPDARPIEPDVGGATGKLIVLAIVLFGLALLVAFLFRSQGWKLTP